LRTLEFTLGDLSAGERTAITYVVEIISGQRNQELVNTATAYADAGLVSNESDARIRLTEDLFRSTSTVIGRVVEGHCSSATFAEDQGVSGIRIYLEDGRFAVSDESGRFHFEGLRPGTHVAQIDPETVPNYFEIIGCDTAPQFAGRADSQFVRTSAGSLTRADFYMRRKLPPEGVVDIEMRNLGTDSTEEVAYVVTVNGEGNIRIRNLGVMVLLPDGVSYLPETLTVAGENTDDPRIVGPSLVVDLPEQFGKWSREIRFEAKISPGTSGELASKAFAQFDSPIETGQKTPIVETRMVREKAVIANEGYVLNLNFAVLSAELSPDDQLQLDALIAGWTGVSDISIAAIGHSDSQRISPANRAVFADNYVLSHARASAAANYVARALNVNDARVTVQGRGPDEPVDSNATASGREANRRVELILSGKRPTKPSFLEVTQATSGVVIAQTQGAVPGAEEEMLRNRPSISIEDISGLPSSQVEPAMSDLTPGVEMLLPGTDFNPAIPTTKISIKHDPRQQLAVSLNGQPVNALNYDGIEVSPNQGFAVSRWKGVDLRDGSNEIRIEVVNPDGSIAKILRRVVNYSGTAVRGEIVPEMSVLVADGKTRPVIAVRLYDRSGEQARQGAVGSFRVNAPYRSWWEVEDERKNDIVAVGSREPIYRVGAGGIALIELEPTTQAGEAELTLNFDNRRQQQLRTWLSAQPRDWILVGFAEGTVGYNTLSDNMTAAVEAGFDDEYFDDGRVAFFAKGQVKGEYLLTVAYDSDRERSENRDRFQTVVDPNAYYSLYADKSEQRFDAPSQRKLYLKLERRQFFALFGDFDTGMSVTELARYERRFNGLKSGFQGENVAYTAFATETSQSFVRDDIRGDGTSGLYQLSRAPIIANSEQVRIEVRDRFDTGEVLTSTTLSRFLDYNLDTLDGSLYFKQPVPSRDQAFNPIFIVVEYESESSANEDIIAGGRASVRTSNDQFEVGVSHINEGQQGAESDLTGLDIRWQLNPETLLKAELASSNRTENNVDSSGRAHSLTLAHQGEKIDVQAYLKEVDEGFGLGQQNTAEKGIRKIGIDGRSQITERFFFDGEASWQQNLETDAIRNAAKAQLRFENDGFTASTGLIHASDKFADGQKLDSNLAEVGVSKKIGDVTLRANGSFELSSDAESVDYPATTVIGADYRIMQGVDLFAEYEQASGPLLETSMSRLGVKASPWSRAQINSSITSEKTEYGPRLFSNVGLIQGFQVSERWVLDVGLDQTSTIADSSIRPFDPARELVSGSVSDDFTAVFVGAVYTADLWTANSRIEYRDSDSEERKSLLSGWYREPSLGHGMSAGLTMFTSENVSGTKMSTADLKFGWAWRKAESRWAFLNRIDLVFEDTELLLQKEESQRLINNFNANRRISARTQLSLQYAFKYVRSMFDAQEFSGYTDLMGIDFRRGFKSRWDWGTHASAYHSYASETVDYGFGLDVGFNVRDNLWLTIGYNIAGFHDSDFASARYTAQGPYLQISMKADQHTLRNIANRP
jgi:flagellar motor protein MotB